MLGKQKCKILKEIRQRIADENEIPYVTHECRYQGECSGTCPRCESELRYLEQQLSLRASMGKRVAVTALCAGMALSTAGCGSAANGPELVNDLGGAVPIEEPGKQPGPEIEILEPVKTEGKDRKEIKREIFEKMNNRYNSYLEGRL